MTRIGMIGLDNDAFAGATEGHVGWLERCNCDGTLMLDEIDDVAALAHLKLQQLSQERRIPPVGSHTQH